MKLEENQLPNGWEVKKLGEVGKCVTGNTPPKNDLENYGDYLPFVKPPQLSNNIIKDAPEKLSEKGAKWARILPINSVLITCIGNLGRTAFNKVPVASNQQINAVMPKEKVIEGGFLFYQAQSSDFKNQLEDFSSATTVAIVNKSKFESIEIVVPPLPEQQAIVAKIEELFSQLENGKKELLTAQAKLKTYRQSLLKSAFEGRLTNENLKYKELPKGWEVKKLGEVCKINPKLPNKDQINSELEVQFLPMKLIEEVVNKIKLTETRTFIEVQKRSYTPFIDEDIIFAKVTPCMENGKIAVVKNLKNGIGFGSSEFHVVRCSESILSKFVFYFLVRDKFRNEAASEMTGAVGLRRVPKQFIENYSINLPPLPEQQAIVAILESKLTICDRVEETITASLKQAETLRQSILKKAFEGRLIVSEIQESLKSNYKNQKNE